MPRHLRGISPVVATVIIVAVAVAISIAVAGWLMGLWGTYGNVEELSVMPDTELYANGTLILHLKSTGTKAAVVTKIEVVNVGSTALANRVTLSQGEETTLSLDLQTTGTIVAGSSYLVKIYTDSGSVYQAYVVAKKP
ncbi:archaellin/type IV pilin N-terminal domain-containing protein [Stetteria hydrogenophila]